MLIPNHPDDERLSALASRDADATADARLTAHVESCARCTELIDELGALRLALSTLPDLQPSRPLQLVPPVEPDVAVDRLGGWARRFFAPVLVSGAALVLVGVVGTAGPAFSGTASSQAGAAPSVAQQEVAAASDATEPDKAAASIAAAAPGYMEGGDGSTRDSATAEPSEPMDTFASNGGLAAADEPESPTDAQDDAAGTLAESNRSPWPMVLFAGVALIVAALLTRWILAPRAG